MRNTLPLRISDEAEIVAILTDAIRQGGGGRMSRVADSYLAGLCAEHLAERLALAGVVCMVRAAGRLSADPAD